MGINFSRKYWRLKRMRRATRLPIFAIVNRTYRTFLQTYSLDGTVTIGEVCDIRTPQSNELPVVTVSSESLP